MFYCSICQEKITDERLEGLTFLGVKDPKQMTCIKCAEQVNHKVKGVFLGESGCSPLVLVDSVSDTDGIKHIDND